MSNESLSSDILRSFRMLGLTSEQYLNSCKQYLYVRRNKDGFSKLDIADQELYLKENDVLNSRFRGDKTLIGLLASYENITLTDIYSILDYASSKVTFSKNIDLDIVKMLEDKDDILLVSAETCLSKLPALCTTDKTITIWTTNTKIRDILDFDFGHRENIKIKIVDVYDNKHEDTKKYKNILCIPQFGLKRHFKRGATYGNDASTIAAELLIKNNLHKDGILTVILPCKVNSSQMEAHFRQAYIGHLVEFINPSSKIFGDLAMESYIYKFSGSRGDGYFYSSISIETVGKKYHVDEITNRNSTWDFNKPNKAQNEDSDLSFSSDAANLKSSELQDIATVLRGKPLPKHVKSVTENEDFIYLDMSSITETGINYSTAKKYTIEGKKDLLLSKLKFGDVIMQNKGNLSKIIVFEDRDKTCIASSDLLVIRVESAVIPRYLRLYLRSNVVQKVFRELYAGRRVPYIPADEVKRLNVVYPNYEQQKKVIIKYRSYMEEYKIRLEHINKKIEDLDNSLDMYFCGKLPDFCKNNPRI